MRRRHSLHVLRRWWSIVLTGAVIGAVLGWVSAPGASSAPPTFEATRILLIEPAAGAGFINRAALMATVGAVPGRVAARLGIDRQRVQAMVLTASRDNLGELYITGRSTDRAQAEALADVTAEELIIEFGGPKAPFRSLEPAVASLAPSDDIKGPTSRPARALVLGAFGVVLGIAASFVVQRFDNRVRTKGSAEEALGLQVLAEIPALSRADAGRSLTRRQPLPYVEAYRGLRTMAVRWASVQGQGDGHRVILVTSPTGGEGKTATVAHLAAALGEAGHSVVALSADFRRPRLHEYFDRAREPGLSEILRGAPDIRRLADLNRATTVRGVQLVPSGLPVPNPAPLLDQFAEHLKEARKLADFVLIDVSPLLTASEAADLAQHADGVILVLRAGNTSVRAAVRSAELLERLSVPLIGAVLVGSNSPSATYTKGFKRAAGSS